MSWCRSAALTALPGFGVLGENLTDALSDADVVGFVEVGEADADAPLGSVEAAAVEDDKE